MLKDTKIRESLSLQFRAEFFNIFNHTNLGLPITGLGGAPLFTDAQGDRIGSADQITSMVGTPTADPVRAETAVLIRSST